MYLLVCTGLPSFALSSSKLNSFLAIKLEGYTCCSAPRLLTTTSALYGLLMPSYLGLAHQSLTCLTCASKISSSADAFSSVDSSWKESVGCEEGSGGSTGARVEDIRAGR